MRLFDTDPAQVQGNPTMMCILSYYLLTVNDYNNLLKLLNNTRDPE